MPKMGLVLQGGGALGAYEYGAVTRLVELGWHPVAVTGVSIGAATAAAVAGALDLQKSKALMGRNHSRSSPVLASRATNDFFHFWQSGLLAHPARRF